jgi:hypothetical protein
MIAAAAPAAGSAENLPAFSILAFAECAVASGVLAYAVVVFEAHVYLLTAVLIAPLLLLQTAYGASIKRRLFAWCEPVYRPAIVRTVVPYLAAFAGIFAALYFYDREEVQAEGIARIVGVLLIGVMTFLAAFVGFSFIWIVFLAAVSTLIRFVATVIAFVRHPADCLVAIPQNWTRVCFRTDFRTPPELFPGADAVEQYSLRRYFLGFRDELLKLAQKNEPPTKYRLEKALRAVEALFEKGLVYLGAGVATALLFLAASSYRISLKSTFLIYLPFFYFASQALFEKQSFEFLKGLRDSVSDKVIAIFIVTTHILVPLAVAFLVGAAVISWPKESLVAALVSYWSFTPVLSANTISKLANAGLVFVCAGLAHLGIRWLVEEDHGAVRRTTTALRLLVAMRALLTLYSIFYVAVLIAYHVDADQVAAGWKGVVLALQSVRVDWSPLPGAPH